MLGRVVRKYFTTSDFAVWPPMRKNYPCHFLTLKGELQRTLHHVLSAVRQCVGTPGEQLKAITLFSSCSRTEWHCLTLRTYGNRSRQSECRNKADDFWVPPVMISSSSKGWQEWKFNYWLHKAPSSKITLMCVWADPLTSNISQARAISQAL